MHSGIWSIQDKSPNWRAASYRLNMYCEGRRLVNVRRFIAVIWCGGDAENALCCLCKIAVHVLAERLPTRHQFCAQAHPLILRAFRGCQLLPACPSGRPAHPAARRTAVDVSCLYNRSQDSPGKLAQLRQACPQIMLRELCFARRRRARRQAQAWTRLKALCMCGSLLLLVCILI